MGCKSMARREIEDPKSACHGQTGGWPNGELGECGRGKPDYTQCGILHLDAEVPVCIYAGRGVCI